MRTGVLCTNQLDKGNSMIRKSIISLWIIAAFVFSCSASDNLLILFSYNNKFGYVDKNLDIVLNPVYEKAEHFSKRGFSIVRFDDTNSAIIDLQGEKVFERTVKNIYFIADDIYSFLDTNGSYTIYRLSNGNVIASGLRTRGYTGSDPYILIGFSDDQSSYGYINFYGELLSLNFELRKYSYPFYEGIAVITKGNWEYSLIDLKGNEISSLRFYRLGQKYSEGLIPAQTEDMTTGYINRVGLFEFKIPFIVGEQPAATDFNEGFALIKIEQNPDTWVVINRKGKIVSHKLEVDVAYGFIEGLSIVSKFNDSKNKNLFGYVNTSGDFLIPPVLERCDNFKDGYARIVYNGREGLLDEKGRVFWSDLLINGRKKGEQFKINNHTEYN